VDLGLRGAAPRPVRITTDYGSGAYFASVGCRKPPPTEWYRVVAAGSPGFLRVTPRPSATRVRLTSKGLCTAAAASLPLHRCEKLFNDGCNRLVKNVVSIFAKKVVNYSL
jgi:hypothetical protein